MTGDADAASTLRVIQHPGKAEDGRRDTERWLSEESCVGLR